MMKRNHWIFLLLTLFVLAASILAIPISATTLSLLDGKVSVTDSQNTVTGDESQLKATAKGSLTSKKTNTITLTNNSGTTANLSFDYTVASASSFTINGTSASTSGSYAKLLQGGEAITIGITSNSGWSNTTVTLTITNLTLTEAAASSNVTLNFDSSLGSVTVDGGSISSGTVHEVSLSTGAALVATPKSGVTFLGWINEADGTLLSPLTSYTLTVASDTTVSAAFASASSPAWFLVGGKYFSDLNVAVSKGTLVIPAANGTLPAGNYTIPAGVTLLIPYDSSNTLCTTKPTIDGSTGFLSSSANSWVKPTAYRTLTMAENANITVNGAISLSGKMCIAQTHNGCPSGPLGFIAMRTGSSITINSGAKLYAWGYITGTGSVTVKNGGTVYENFQVKDWRGGTAASSMLDKDERVFPVTQYYVQNVEVPMTLETGATEYAYMGLVASKCYGDATVPFIGTGSMFINSGSIVKDYNEELDCLEVDVYGNLSMSSLVMSVDASIASYDMNSANYVLPITNNLHVNIISGTTTISQDMAFLPGSSLTIDEGATVTLSSGVSLFIYDLDQWKGNLFVYSSCDVSPLKYVGATAGAPNARPTMTDAKVIVNGTLDASAGNLYTTAGVAIVSGETVSDYSGGGANICSTGAGTIITKTTSNAITYQYKQSESAYYQVPVTPAQLLNGDGSGYVPIASATGTAPYTYKYDATHKRWVQGEHKDNGTGCDHAKTWTVCTCGATYDELARKYNVYVTDYQGNKTLLGNLAYGTAPSLTLKNTESNCFVMSHTGWSYSGTTFAAASGFWALVTDANVTSSTTDLTIEGQYTPTAIKPGAITMTVNYNNLPAGTAMQVIFFVPVETVDSKAPEVLLNGAKTGVDNVHVGEAEGNPIAMYQVTVDLTAAQVAEKATGESGNAAITITYTDVNLTKQLDSVLLAYAKALQSQLSGSAMGSQANAMEAVMNYGAAVQIYFNAGNEFDFAFTGYTADEIEKYASNIDLSGNAMSNTENGITFTWKSANVNFRTEYNLRYYFTLTGLPEGVTPTTATLTVTYADGKTPAAVYENLAVEADGSRYRVTYPVPASDLAKEGTSVKLVVTLSDGTTVSSSDFSYGINAYLKRSIYQYTEGQKKVANDTDGTKTTQYVNMLVSLIKLGEAVSEIESTTATE